MCCSTRKRFVTEQITWCHHLMLQHRDGVSSESLNERRCNPFSYLLCHAYVMQCMMLFWCSLSAACYVMTSPNCECSMRSWFAVHSAACGAVICCIMHAWPRTHVCENGWGRTFSPTRSRTKSLPTTTRAQTQTIKRERIHTLSQVDYKKKESNVNLALR